VADRHTPKPGDLAGAQPQPRQQARLTGASQSFARERLGKRPDRARGPRAEAAMPPDRRSVAVPGCWAPGSGLRQGSVVPPDPGLVRGRVVSRGWPTEWWTHLPEPVLIWRSGCQVSSVDAPLVACVGVGGCARVGRASGEVLDVGQAHMRGLTTPGPWFRR